MAAKPTQNTAATDEKPETSAALASEKLPTEPPAGAPTLRAVSSLKRRVRADFFSKLRNLPLNDEGDFVYEGVSMLGRSASMLSMIADIEEALRILAIDPLAYDDWAGSADDSELMDLFSYAFSTMQVGEADASPSS